jgi:hypothetical protein
MAWDGTTNLELEYFDKFKTYMSNKYTGEDEAHEGVIQDALNWLNSRVEREIWNEDYVLSGAMDSIIYEECDRLESKFIPFDGDDAWEQENE